MRIWRKTKTDACLYLSVNFNYVWFDWKTQVYVITMRVYVHIMCECITHFKELSGGFNSIDIHMYVHHVMADTYLYTINDLNEYCNQISCRQFFAHSTVNPCRRSISHLIDWNMLQFNFKWSYTVNNSVGRRSGMLHCQFYFGRLS